MKLRGAMTEYAGANTAGAPATNRPPVLVEASEASERILPARKRRKTGPKDQPAGVMSTQRFEVSALKESSGSARIELIMALQDLVGDDSDVLTLVPREGGAGEVSVGRDAGCDVVIDDPTISGTHVIFDVDFQVMIRDEGSSNGTFINGEKLEPEEDAIIQSGDCIRLGGQVYYFLSGDRMQLFLQHRAGSRAP